MQGRKMIRFFLRSVTYAGGICDACLTRKLWCWFRDPFFHANESVQLVKKKRITKEAQCPSEREWLGFSLPLLKKNGCKQSKKCSTNKASPYCRQTKACIWFCLLYICPGVHLKRPKRASTIAKGSACQQLRPNSSRWRAEVMCFARRRQ